MTQSLKTVRSSFHAHFLNVRNCNNLIWSYDFEVAYKAATDRERLKISEAITNGDTGAIKKFISDKINSLTPFEKMGIRKLREIGKNLRIPDYEKLTKYTLIEEIKYVVQRLKETSQRISVQPKDTDTSTENTFGCGQSKVLASTGY